MHELIGAGEVSNSTSHAYVGVHVPDASPKDRTDRHLPGRDDREGGVLHLFADREQTAAVGRC